MVVLGADRGVVKFDLASLDFGPKQTPSMSRKRP